MVVSFDNRLILESSSQQLMLNPPRRNRCRVSDGACAHALAQVVAASSSVLEWKGPSPLRILWGSTWTSKVPKKRTAFLRSSWVPRPCYWGTLEGRYCLLADASLPTRRAVGPPTPAIWDAWGQLRSCHMSSGQYFW